MQELKGHTDGICCLVGTSNNTVWSGSMEGDGSIRVWECEENRPQLTITVASSSLKNSSSYDYEDLDDYSG